MNTNETCRAILKKVSTITDIVPEVYYRDDCNSIMITWRGDIPDEITTLKIAEALIRFGTPIPNHFRDCNFVSFIIHLY